MNNAAIVGKTRRASATSVAGQYLCGQCKSRSTFQPDGPGTTIPVRLGVHTALPMPLMLAVGVGVFT